LILHFQRAAVSFQWVTFVPFCQAAPTDIPLFVVISIGGEIGDFMKPLQSLLTACAIFAVLCSASFAQNATLSPDLVRVIVQAELSFRKSRFLVLVYRHNADALTGLFVDHQKISGG